MELKIVNENDQETKNSAIMEVRQLDVTKSMTTIGDVPLCIIPESVHFHSVDDPSAVLMNQRCAVLPWRKI